MRIKFLVISTVMALTLGGMCDAAVHDAVSGFGGKQAAAGTLKMCWVWDNHMVLQADRPVPVWGRALPGETVTVSFAGQTKTAATDEQGQWGLTLDPLSCSAEGRVFEVKTANASLRFEDVLVGDVWICSGQSNMAQPSMGQATGAEAELNEPPTALARAYYVPYNIWAAEPQLDNFPAERKISNWFYWEHISGRTPAVPYYFGKMLQRETGRPIGLIVVPLGASTAEAWVPQSAMLAEPLFADYVRQSREFAAKLPEASAAFRATVQAWKERQAQAEANGEKFTERQPNTGLNPQFWARWWAGSLYNSHIAPLRNMAVKGVIWYQGEQNAAGHGGSVSTAEGYVQLMKILIASWREQFGQPELPFYQVQLSMFNWNDFNNRRPRDPNMAGWSVIREAQARVAATVPHSGLAISIDIGDKANIHPPNKRPVGERLARLALRDVYGQEVIADGPQYDKYRVEDGKIRISFTNLHGGLKIGEREGIEPGRLVGFAVAGVDRKFVWAEAAIDGDTVLVWSAEVPEPVAVRYGYTQYQDVNLYNAAGLPAAPFRTDDWPLVPPPDENETE